MGDILSKTNVIILILAISSGISLTTFGISLANNIIQEQKYEELYEDFQDLLSDYDELYNSYSNLSSTYQILTGDYEDLNDTYWDLNSSYTDLESDYNQLSADYNQLSADYNQLSTDYNNLESAYNALNAKYQTVINWIQKMIPPCQYLVFADAVRRHYMDIYLDFSTSKSVYKTTAEFCRDVVLHDSGQKNEFTEVSNAFEEALKFGSNTTKLANFVMNESFAKDSPYWGISYWKGKNLAGDEITDIDSVHSDACDLIDYEYDSNITVGQEDPEWDYFKFAVETAFRTLGDCDDQAIFDATYLESCGFETALAFVHDPAHPTYGAFYHASLFVHIEDTAAYNLAFPSVPLWTLGSVDPYTGYTWCWLDPTWDTPFGSEAAWISAYSSGLGSDILTVAICDIDGEII